MTIQADDMKAIMRLWSSGVTVVTSTNEHTRAGTTASSFTSVSLEPPLILVSLFHESGTTKQIEQNGHFAVSILGEEHAAVSAQMAGFGDVPPGEDKFYGLEWKTAQTGSLIYADALAWLDCELYAIYEAGTHKVILGQIIDGERKDDPAYPLVYFNRGYHHIPRSDNGSGE